MARALSGIAVEVLADGDLVAVAQCIAIDAEAFPYESARFGKRPVNAIVWVAREEGRPDHAGKARVGGFLAARVRADRLEIDGVAVGSFSRRRGLGRELVRAALAESRARGLRVVVLHVAVENSAAIGLYEGEGFAVRRRLRGFYPPAAAFGGERDAYEMVKRP
jgi:ribosomal protein S18 acetylase RimI-like enzyme